MSDDARPDEGGTREGRDGGDGATPPATFDFLVHTLFTQALMAFGRIPNPITKQSVRNLATARHFIETLEMLEKKTAGNLTADEGRLLEEIQHQLRMLSLTESETPGGGGT